MSDRDPICDPVQVRRSPAPPMLQTARFRPALTGSPDEATASASACELTLVNRRRDGQFQATGSTNALQPDRGNRYAEGILLIRCRSPHTSACRIELHPNSPQLRMQVGL